MFPAMNTADLSPSTPSTTQRVGTPAGPDHTAHQTADRSLRRGHRSRVGMDRPGLLDPSDNGVTLVVIERVENGR